MRVKLYYKNLYIIMQNKAPTKVLYASQFSAIKEKTTRHNLFVRNSPPNEI